jgi:hypothetical protein
MTTTVSLWNGSTWSAVNTNRIFDIEYDDGGTKKLNSAVVIFDRAILGDALVPENGMEIKITVDGTDIFAGTISRPISDYPLFKVECVSYGEVFLDKYVNEIFLNKSPEYIVQYIITNYTKLTYASTVTTGVTIARIVFRKKRIVEVLTKLANILDYIFYTDTTKHAYFEPRAAVSSGVTLEVGNNVVNKPVWDYNPDSVVTKLSIEGDKQDFSNSETFSATAGQTVFTIVYEPAGNVNVTVAGTRKNPSVNGFGDYVVDPSSKTITFAAGLTVGQSVVISYSYKIPVQVTVPSETYDNSGTLIEKELTLVIKSIKSFKEAREYANKYLLLHSQPSKSTELKIIGFNLNLKSGRTVLVIDADDSINEQLVILGVTYSYSDNMTSVRVGTVEQTFYDWHKEVIEKLQELSQEDTNTEKLQLYVPFKENVAISLGSTYVGSTRLMADTMTTDGHVTLSRLRASRDIEADCSGNTNIGTWSGAGIGGSQYNPLGYRLGCGSFNGSDNFVTLGVDMALGAGQPQTYVCFIKLGADGTNSAASQGFFKNDFFVGYVRNSTNDIAFRFSDGIQAREVSYQLGAGDRGWHMFVATWDGNRTSTLYIDRVLRSQTTFPNAPTANYTNLNVGRNKNTGYFLGMIDEFMIFNTDQITIQDQNDIYNKVFDQNHSKFANCKVWWAFDDPHLGDRRAAKVTFASG